MKIEIIVIQIILTSQTTKMPNCAECGLLFSNDNLSRSQIDGAIICDECVSREACIVCHQESSYRINDVCYCDTHYVPKPASIDPENGMWICECGKEALELNGFCDEKKTYECYRVAKLKRKCIHCDALQIPNGHVCSVCNSHQHIIQEKGKNVKRYVKRGGFSFDKHF